MCARRDRCVRDEARFRRGETGCERDKAKRVRNEVRVNDAKQGVSEARQGVCETGCGRSEAGCRRGTARRGGETRTQ